MIEESEVFYLDDPEFQKQLKDYIHKNFYLKKQFDEDNIFKKSNLGYTLFY